MSVYKEFEGKTLDEAIRDACEYYDTTRDKLEIDILNDAKAGIFGLVGTKKARVRARLVELTSVLEGLDSLSAKGRPQKKRNEAPAGDSRRGKAEQRPDARTDARADAREDAARKERSAKPTSSATSSFMEAAEAVVADVLVTSDDENAPSQVEASAQQANERQDNGQGEGKRGGRHARMGCRDRSGSEGRRPRQENGKPMEAEKFAAPSFDADSADLDAEGEEFSRVPFEQLDVAELETAAREIVSRLTKPFLGDVTIGVSVGSDRVRISVTDVEDPGLLIGRDGQTLASLQYLVTRMLSNRMKALLRVQIDAGDYRERQDERLREMALSLAEKVKAGGRPQVTRPLSSYHRRVIHLTLQDDPLIQTHSKGEGEMKRVMVARRKNPA